jgi:hypothetical protein
MQDANGVGDRADGLDDRRRALLHLMREAQAANRRSRGRSDRWGPSATSSGI